MSSSDAGLVTTSLTRVTDDIWIADGAPISAAGLQLPVQMTVIRLSNGDLLLHSPVRYSSILRDQLARLGPIKRLQVLNVEHSIFLPRWQIEVPEASAFA